MKTRNGFVSNSSTSSFFVFGVEAPEIDVLSKMLFGEKPKKEEPKPEPGCVHKFDRKKMKFCPECGKPAWIMPEIEEDESEYEDYDELSSDVERKWGVELVYCSDGYDGEWYLGANMKSNPPLDKLVAIDKKLKELFKGETAFHYGVSEG
jgi:hypothetical protein